MPGPAHDHIAKLLFTMQEIVKANPKNGKPAPEVLFGAVLAGHFGQARQALGIAQKWATLEETSTALATAVAGGASPNPGFPVSAEERELAAAGDIDLAGYDVGMEGLGGPVPTMCWRCQHTGRTKEGACLKCGAYD